MMETIDIYNRDGVLKVTVQPLPRSVYKSELMVGDTVTLCYNSPEFTLEAGDYVLYNEEKFKIITLASPQRTSTGYQIEQVFAAEWMEWGHRILFFDRGKSKEKAWSMTHKIEYFADIVVSNIKNAGLGEYVCSFSAGLGDSKFLQFDGTDIITALNMIAEAWQTEWRVTGANIVFGKCEYGSRVVTLTEGKEIASITKAETTSGNAVTRLYAFGSDKNLPSSYRADDKDVVSAVVARNLHLPEGVDYIDLRPDMAQEEIVEGTAIFEDVYPRRIGKISVVYSEDHVETDEATKKETKWTVYRFTDEGLDFREKYIIPGQELHIIFQTGKLAGMDFAVIFNPGRYEESERDAQRFEIVRNETYGAKIPNATLKPSPGDTYVMYGYDTSFVGDTLVGEAEQELLIRARQWLEEENKDATTYECVMNEIRCKGYEEVEGELTFDIDKVIDLYVGAPVLLRSSLYGDRESRVRAVGVRLDGKGRTYTIGKSARYSRLDSLSSKVDEIQYASSNMSGHGSVYVIGSNDQTPASDKNVYSAKRTDKQIAGLDSKYLRKDIDDTAQGHITFNEGLTANDEAYFNDGLTARATAQLKKGAKIGEDASITEDGIAKFNKVNAQVVEAVTKVVTNVIQSMSDSQDLNLNGKVYIDNEGGIRHSDFIPDIMTGQKWAVNNLGEAELESLIVRTFLRVPVLDYNKVTASSGTSWSAPGAGVILKTGTDENGDSYFDLKLEEGEIGSFVRGDICMGVWHFTGKDKNMNASDGDAKNDESGTTVAGFTKVYFMVSEVVNYTDENGTTYQNGRCYVVYRERNGMVRGEIADGMTVVAYGHDLVLDSTEGRITTDLANQEMQLVVDSVDFSNDDRTRSWYKTVKFQRYLINMNGGVFMHLRDKDGSYVEIKNQGEENKYSDTSKYRIQNENGILYVFVKYKESKWDIAFPYNVGMHLGDTKGMYVDDYKTGGKVALADYSAFLSNVYFYGLLQKLDISQLTDSEGLLASTNYQVDLTSPSAVINVKSDGSFSLIDESGMYLALTSVYVHRGDEPMLYIDDFSEESWQKEANRLGVNTISEPDRRGYYNLSISSDGVNSYKQTGTAVTVLGILDSALEKGAASITFTVEPYKSEVALQKIYYISFTHDAANTYTSYVFRRHPLGTASVTAPTGGSYQNAMPTDSSWKDSIPSGEGEVWMAWRTFYSDGSESKEGDVNYNSWKVSRMTDTETTDYEFSKNEKYNALVYADGTPVHGNSTEAKARKKALGWTDSGEGTESVWMATSHYKNGSWSEWTYIRVQGEKGDKGDQGIQGEKGEKGEKGDQGIQGLRGLQGEKGEQGIQGEPGQDGRTSHFHVKYASVNNPASASQMSETPNTYIGTYVDFESADSNDPKKYTWHRFEGLQGPKGDQGIPGVGNDGKTSYLHIKYSDDGGITFTAEGGEKPGTYIGVYTDFVQADSNSVSAYKWSKVKGEKGDKGDQGIQGEKGEKGDQGIQGEKGEKGEKGDSSIIYEIVPNPSVLSFARDDDGNLTPSSRPLYVNVIRHEGKSSVTYDKDRTLAGYRVYIGTDKDTGNLPYVSVGRYFNISASAVESVSAYRLELWKMSDNNTKEELVKTCTVAVNKEGKPGVPGESIPGISALTATVVPSSLTIDCDSEGKPLKDSWCFLTILLYEGDKRITEGFDVDFNPAHISGLNIQKDQLKIEWFKDYPIASASLDVIIVYGNRTISVPFPIIASKQGASSIGQLSKMARNRGEFSTLQTYFNNEYWNDYVRVGSKYFFLGDTITRWDGQAGKYYYKNDVGTELSGNITAAYIPKAQTTGDITNSYNRTLWHQVSNIGDVSARNIIATSVSSDNANVGEIFIGKTSKGVTDAQGGLSVTNSANGWLIQDGRIFHTKTKLALTADGYLKSPDGLHLLVGDSSIKDTLLNAGLDIDSESIIAKANRFECRNLKNERTAWLDDTGTFTVAGVFNNLVNVIDWENNIGRDKVIVAFFRGEGKEFVAYYGSDDGEGGQLYDTNGNKISSLPDTQDSELHVEAQLDMLRLGNVVRVKSLPRAVVDFTGEVYRLFTDSMANTIVPDSIRISLPYYVDPEHNHRNLTRYNTDKNAIPHLMKADEMRMLAGKRVILYNDGCPNSNNVGIDACELQAANIDTYDFSYQFANDVPMFTYPPTITPYYLKANGTKEVILLSCQYGYFLEGKIAKGLGFVWSVSPNPITGDIGNIDYNWI